MVNHKLVKRYIEMYDQKGGGKKENIEFHHGVKYTPTAEKNLERIRKKIKKEIRKIDFKNDQKSGEKIVKVVEDIVVEALRKLNNMRVEYPNRKELILEIEQGLMNEHPIEFDKFKAKALRRIGHKVKKSFKIVKKVRKKPVKKVTKKPVKKVTKKPVKKVQKKKGFFAKLFM